MRSIIFLLSILLLSSPTVAQQNCSESMDIPGRFQVSTTYREAGNWVFVTIIDTCNGQIVSQEMFSGFGSYTRKN